MRPRHLVLFLTALVLGLPATVSAGDNPPPKGHKTPQAAFDALVRANRAGKWKEFCNCLTPDSRDVLAGVLVLAGGDIKSSLDAVMNKEKDEEKKALLKTIMKTVMKPVMDAYEKHGITEKHLEKSGGMMSLLFTGGDAEKVKKALTDAAKPVKRRTAFIDDLLTAIKKLEKTFGKGGKESALEFFPADAKLEGLKVTGDTAKGTLVGTKKGVEKRDPIHFKKLQDGWRVELPMDTPGAKGEPKQPDGKNGDQSGSLGAPPAREEAVRVGLTVGRAQGTIRRNALG
jgi:ribosomal protein S20